MAKKEETLKEGTKFDTGKPRYTTMPILATQSVMDVFTYGANKYEAYNYSKGMKHTRYIDAAIRHINAYLIGEDIDESGNPHLAHAACSILMALDNILLKVGNDDRNHNYKKAA